MSHKEALTLALEALACCRDMVGHPENLEYIDKKIHGVKEALAQPEHEPDLGGVSVFYPTEQEPLKPLVSKIDEEFMAALGRAEHLDCHNEQHKEPEQDTCKGCNGNGVVGNILDTDTCPFCNGSGIEAQSEQETVAWGVDWGKDGQQSCVSIVKRKPNGGIEVVAIEYNPTPSTPQRTWVGLTPEEIDEIWRTHLHRDSRVFAIEAKLKEKNFEQQSNT